MKMKMDFSRAEKRFSRKVKQFTEKETAEIVSDTLNRKGAEVMKLTMKRTKKASAAAIRAELKANGLAYKIMQKAGGIKSAMLADKYAKRNRIRKRKGAVAAGKSYKEVLAQRVKKFIAARARSAGYIRAGWFPAAKVFGLNGGKNRPGKSAERGKGKRATRKRLEASMENVAFKASELSRDPLIQSIRIVRMDMMKYLARKLGNAWNKRR